MYWIECGLRYGPGMELGNPLSKICCDCELCLIEPNLVLACPKSRLITKLGIFVQPGRSQVFNSKHLLSLAPHTAVANNGSINTLSFIYYSCDAIVEPTKHIEQHELLEPSVQQAWYDVQSTASNPSQRGVCSRVALFHVWCSDATCVWYGIATMCV